MNHPKKKTGNSAGLKYLLMLPVIAGFICISCHAFSQSQPSQTPPPPPPPPDELLKKINPFRKHKKDTSANKAADTAKNKANVSQATPPPGPPPPPNPLNLFKRKKDTTKKDN